MIIDSLESSTKYFIGVKVQEGRNVHYNGTCPGSNGPICSKLDLDNWPYFQFFKRDWFHSFQYFYHKYGEGWGQTFNMKVLYQAADCNAVLAVVMPKRNIYYVYAHDALDYITREGTKRVPSTEVGEEGSIPARMLSPDDPRQNV